MTSTNLDRNKGTFEFTVAPALTTGQAVKIQQIVPAKDGESEDKRVSAASTVQPAVYNFGRAHAHFTFGGILAKDDRENTEVRDFSKTQVYLGLNLEYDWRVPTKRPGVDDWKADWMLASYLDMRLTSIPVSASGETDPVKTFLASRKAAVFQGGVFLPVYLKQTAWRFGGKDQALFFSPIGKFGFQTISGSVQTQRGDVDDLFEFVAGGLRLGHIQIQQSSEDSAPEMFSYIDFAWGKWENFERCTVPLEDPPMCPDDARENFTRLGIEARVKIPKTPLLVGFDLAGYPLDSGDPKM